MLSRVAETMYWLARQVERAENSARIVAVNANLLLDLPRGIAPGWRPLVDITGAHALFEQRYSAYDETQVLQFLLGDERNPGAILSALAAARENCRTIRDIVPREGWEQINELYLDAREGLAQGLTKGGRHAYLSRVILGCQTVSGLLSGTMLHDQGYDFIRLGRYLERADMTTRIVDVRSAGLLPAAAEMRPYATIQWVSVLKSMSAYQMYRRSEQVRVERGAVLRFLFKSSAFPRAVNHCCEGMRASLERLARNEAALRVAGRLSRKLLGTQVQDLSQDELHRFVDDLQQDIGDLHQAIAQTWFPPVAVEAA
jgi:uncharacterized alpha-E superfamily protein